MGFTPLAGLMMGTRSGDLDPGIIEFLMKKGWSQEKVFETLNKKSGFLGVSGLTSDARGILEAMENGHEGRNWRLKCLLTVSPNTSALT